MKLDSDVEIKGLDRLGQSLPNEKWHRLTLYIRKATGGAEVFTDGKLVEVDNDDLPPGGSVGQAIPK